MPRKLLPIISNIDGHTVLEKAPGDISPYQGEWGEEELLCGNCRHTLAEHALADPTEGIVIRCPMCSAYNLTGGPAPEEEPPSDGGWGRLGPRYLRRP